MIMQKDWLKELLIFLKELANKVAVPVIGSWLVPLITLMLCVRVLNLTHHKEYGRDKPDERTATCREARC